MTAQSYWLWLLPSLLLSVLLAAMLMLREWQNQKTIQTLLDRILVKEGLEPLPNMNPIAEFVGNEPDPDMAEKIQQSIQAIRRRHAKNAPMVRMPIPGMPFAGMGEVKKRG